MTVELLRRAATLIREDMARSRETYVSAGALNRIEASELVADWLDHVATALESDDPEELLGFGEPTDARAVAAAYLGEAVTRA